MDTTGMPKTRGEAKKLGVKYYFTGEPCKHGHIAPRKTKGICIECMRAEYVKYFDKRAEYFRQYNRSEAGLKTKRKYYEANRDLVIARAQARPDVEKRRFRYEWKQRNPDWVKVDVNSRRRRNKNATPSWITKEQKKEMRRLYKMAIELTKITGIEHVVDHDYPLRSDLVCGLHVPANLKIMTREDNLAKSNRFDI